MRFGNNVRRWREAKGLTTQQLGDMVGMQQGNLSKIENGRTWIGRKKLIALAEALAVPVATLFHDDENESDSTGKITVEPSIGRNRLPVWDYSTAARFVYSSPTRTDRFRELPKDQKFLLTDQDYPKTSFALRVTDDSMMPALGPGMVAIVDPSRTPKPNSVVAVLVSGPDGDEVVLRYFHDRGVTATGEKRFEVVPKNRAYRTLSSETDQISVVGVAAEQRQYL